MSLSYVRRTPIDVLEVDGESLVLFDDARVVRLSPIATAVFGLTASARTAGDLAVALEEVFGPPADVATLDAAAFGMDPQSVIAYLSDHVDEGRLPSPTPNT